MTYEENIKELDTIIEKLDSGKLTLEESLKYFEKGTKNIKACNEMLNEAKGKIFVLKQELDEIVEQEKE